MASHYPSKATRNPGATQDIHESWKTFMGYCEKIRYGTLTKLTIQDGIPVSAESTTQKISFTKPRDPR